MTDVAVVGGSEEIRLLLRGLVRLHRHRVVAEGSGPEALEQLPSSDGPLVVLLDADLDDGAWAEGIATAFRGVDHRRGVLITPSRSPRIEQLAKTLGLSSVLRRPFAVHELVEVLAVSPIPPVSGPSAPAPGSALGPSSPS